MHSINEMESVTIQQFGDIDRMCTTTVTTTATVAATAGTTLTVGSSSLVGPTAMLPQTQMRTMEVSEPMVQGCKANDDNDEEEEPGLAQLSEEDDDDEEEEDQDDIRRLKSRRRRRHHHHHNRSTRTVDSCTPLCSSAVTIPCCPACRELFCFRTVVGGGGVGGGKRDAVLFEPLDDDGNGNMDDSDDDDKSPAIASNFQTRVQTCWNEPNRRKDTLSFHEVDSNNQRTYNSPYSNSNNRPPNSRNPNQTFTICQVRQHNHKDSAWILVGTTIYDVTSYLSQHPGGIQSILSRAGGVKDCTRDFHFHSKRGQQAWKPYQIGRLVDCPVDVGDVATHSSPSSSSSPSRGSSPWWIWNWNQ